MGSRRSIRDVLFSGFYLPVWHLGRFCSSNIEVCLSGHNLGKRYPGRVTAEFCNTTYNSDLVLRVLYSLSFSLYQEEAGLIWVMLQGCPEY